MGDSLTAQTIRINGHNGDEVEAYLVQPSDPANGEGRGGVVVIHHLPGYDRATKEIARRFTELGYNAICPNLYTREAPGAAPDDAAATARALGGVADKQVIGDVAGAAAYLRSLPGSNGNVGTIGYCSGGRQSVLVACNLTIDAAVDCYGAFVIGSAPAGSGLKMTGIEEQLPNLSCPLLGLFGADDQHPSPDDVARLGELLTEHGKTFEEHSYTGAGHAFFATDRPSYRVEAANDGWQRITEFYGRYL